MTDGKITCVCLHMVFQVVLQRTSKGAERTTVWLLSSVHSQMSYHGLFIEFPQTYFTLVPHSTSYSHRCSVGVETVTRSQLMFTKITHLLRVGIACHWKINQHQIITYMIKALENPTEPMLSFLVLRSVIFMDFKSEKDWFTRLGVINHIIHFPISGSRNWWRNNYLILQS